MKKKIGIVLLVLVLLLFVPIPSGMYKDGGTKEYRALAYRIVKWNRLLDLEYTGLDAPEFQDGCLHKTSLYWFPDSFKGLDALYEAELQSILDREGYIDYLVLVNKENKLPDGWEDSLETVTIRNSLGEDVEVEKRSYDAYSGLKDALAREGIYVELDSARRSIAAQQRIWDDFMVQYGEVYTKTYVAVPGYSEHHTGLALDLYLVIDGADVYENEDMIEYTDIWARIHELLPEYGFILRYLEGKESITGYGYEPWHIRYVGSPETAKDIAGQGLTLEEYLGRLPLTDVTPPED